MKKRVFGIVVALAIFLLLPSLSVQGLESNKTFSVNDMNTVPIISQSSTGGYALKSDGNLWSWSYGWVYAEQIEGVSGDDLEGSAYNTNSDFIRVVGNYGLKENGELWAWGDAVIGRPKASNAVKIASDIAMVYGESIGPDFFALKTNGDLIKWTMDVNDPYETRKSRAFSKEPMVILSDVIHYQVHLYQMRALKSDGTLWKFDTKGNITKEMDNVAAFSFGGQTVVLVIKNDGTLWAWGDNTYGQVGNGGGYTRISYGGVVGETTYYHQDTPVKILDDVIYANAGYSSFAITSDGTLYGWGSNDNNELGFIGGDFMYDAHYGIKAFQKTPKVITTNVGAVSTYNMTTFVLKRDGSLWSCGLNSMGTAGLSVKKHTWKVDKLTKVMDGVALPNRRASLGATPKPSVPDTPSTTNATSISKASKSVGKSKLPVIIFADEQGRINQISVEGHLTTNYNTGEKTDERVLTVTTYSHEYMPIKTRTFYIELPYIGGLLVCEDYNFMVFYAHNLKERDNVEVMRVIKYSKEWERLGQTSIYGGEILSYGLGYGGGLSYAECNGMLYIHTAQSMYKSSDGINHQANLTLCIRMSDMVLTDSNHEVSNNSTGYVSHSRSQYIMVDSEDNIITLDHGDAYPNGAFLYRYGTKAGSDKFTGINGEGIILKKWATKFGAWDTNSQTQSMVETSKGYLTAYFDTGIGDGFDRTKHPNNVYVTFTPRDKFNIANTKTYAVTSFTSVPKDNPYHSQFVPIDMESGYFIMIARDLSIINSGNYHQGMYWAKYSADGTMTPLVKLDTEKAAYGNILYINNQLVWLENNGDFKNDKKDAKFYTFDGKTLTRYPDTPAPRVISFADLNSDHWSYKYVQKAATNELVKGIGDNKFDPERIVSNAEWATMTVNLFYKNDKGRNGDYWWSANMDIAGSKRNIFVGTAVATNGIRNWDASKVQSGINRYDMAQVIYNIAKEQNWAIPEASGVSAKIADWSEIPTNYRNAVAYCFNAGFVSGLDGKGTFGGSGVMTRAQAATVLCRLLDAKNAN